MRWWPPQPPHQQSLNNTPPADDETVHGLNHVFCAATNPPLTSQISDEEKQVSCILSAGNSISQNCTLGLGLERDGMAVAIISLVPRRAACLWSRARAGQESRRWVGEGRQPWVGFTTWASLMGRQPSAWYVGMRAAAAHADVRGF